MDNFLCRQPGFAGSDCMQIFTDAIRNDLLNMGSNDYYISSYAFKLTTYA